MMAFMVIMALCVIWSHWPHWSHLVTVKIKDLNNDGIDGYYGSMASNPELKIRKESKKFITY